MRNVIFIFTVFIFTSYVQSTTIIVPSTQYPTIQAGIDSAIVGDTVLVEPGTYVENININSKNIVLASLFLTTRKSSYISQTIIDGDKKSCVVSISDADSTMMLCGFTIINGLGGAVEGGGIWYWGAGISCEGGNPILSDLKIMENSCTSRGGGILLQGSNPKLINLTITGNISYQGGGIFLSSSCAFFKNITVTGNNANQGGGIYLEDSFFLPLEKWRYSVPIFDNISRCNIYSNSADQGSDLFGNNDTMTVNVSLDTFTVLIPDSTHAYPLNKFTFDILNASVTYIPNNSKVASKFSLKQNYPNPFNPTTTISYALPVFSRVDLSIYNLLGQKVFKLVSSKQSAGSYKVVWNSAGFASGIYVYRLETDKGFVQSRKLILLK